MASYNRLLNNFVLAAATVLIASAGLHIWGPKQSYTIRIKRCIEEVEEAVRKTGREILPPQVKPEKKPLEEIVKKEPVKPKPPVAKEVSISLKELYALTGKMSSDTVAHTLISELELLTAVVNAYDKSKDIISLPSSVMNDCLNSRGRKPIKPGFKGNISYQNGKVAIKSNELKKYKIPGSAGSVLIPKYKNIKAQLYKKGDTLIVTLDDKRSLLLKGGRLAFGLKDFYVETAIMFPEGKSPNKKMRGTLFGRTVKDTAAYRVTKKNIGSSSWLGVDKGYISSAALRSANKGNYIKYN